MTKLNDFGSGTPVLWDNVLTFNADSEMKVSLGDLYWAMVPDGAGAHNAAGIRGKNLGAITDAFGVFATGNASATWSGIRAFCLIR